MKISLYYIHRLTYILNYICLVSIITSCRIEFWQKSAIHGMGPNLRGS